VYIMASKSGTLYTGVTNDLTRRVWEHKHGIVKGFTSRYRITRLVHYEVTSDIHAAIAREKRIKAWRRAKKIALIEGENPGWKDLSAGWFDGEGSSGSQRCGGRRRDSSLRSE